MLLLLLLLLFLLLLLLLLLHSNLVYQVVPAARGCWWPLAAGRAHQPAAAERGGEFEALDDERPRPEHRGEAFDQLNAVQFRQRFEDKGRFRDYLSAVPTFLIRHPYAALIGAARAALAAEASA